MAAENFKAALANVLISEGGNDDDPHDPGGRTGQGILQREYSAYLRNKGLPPGDVWKMPDEHRDDIYKIQYWDRAHCDEMAPGVDYFVFDSVVNAGVSQGNKWLQRALNVPADGVVGQVTLDALAEIGDDDALIGDMAERRMAFYRALKTFQYFGKGWTARVEMVEKIGQKWAPGSVGEPVLWVANGHKKARLADAMSIPSRTGAGVTVGTAASTATITTALDAAKDQIAPLAGASPWLHTIVAGLTVGSIGLGVAGLAWHQYATYRKHKLEDALDLRISAGVPAA